MNQSPPTAEKRVTLGCEALDLSPVPAVDGDRESMRSASPENPGLHGSQVERGPPAGSGPIRRLQVNPGVTGNMTLPGLPGLKHASSRRIKGPNGSTGNEHGVCQNLNLSMSQGA